MTRVRRVPGRVGAALAAVIALGDAPRTASALQPAPVQRRPAPRAQSSAGPPPNSVLHAPIDPTQGVNFRAAVDRDVVYVGEQITYQVGVFLDDDTRRRLRRNPEFTPPEPRAMLAYDLRSLPGPSGTRVEGGRRYEVHVFRRALFPITPGRTAIPAARLSYALPLSNSFFAREERRTARAESLPVTVRPLPDAGRPGDFRGAVGRFDLTVRVDSAAARVGDPLLLTLRVRGDGNIKLLPRPALALDWALTVPAGESVAVDSSRTAVGGYKDFAWLVTPQREGDVTVPALRYPYFDPTAERYDVALSAPRALRVRAGSLVAVDPRGNAAREVPRLAIRPRFRGEEPPVLPQRAWFWAATFLAPLPAVVAGAAHRERRRAPRTAAQELRTLARLAEPPAAVVRRRFAAALAARVVLAPDALASGAALARALRRSGVTPAVASDAAALLGELNAAAFGAGRSAAPDAAARAATIYGRVDAEARHRLAPPLWQWLIVAGAASVLAAGAVRASDVDGARAAFDEGVRAYDQGRVAAAAGSFAEAARLAPRAGDAWANHGTAAWAAGDTAHAAVGWQRALRLEPTADDLRERLELLPGTQLGGATWVPPVPVSLAAGLALLLWVAACGVAFRRALARRRAVPPPSWALGAAAVACGAVAWAADDARTARRLDVVTESGETRAAPALGAEPGPSLRVGEVVRVLDRREAWTRVVVDGGREGWVEARRLTPLRAD